MFQDILKNHLPGILRMHQIVHFAQAVIASSREHLEKVLPSAMQLEQVRTFRFLKVTFRLSVVFFVEQEPAAVHQPRALQKALTLVGSTR